VRPTVKRRRPPTLRSTQVAGCYGRSGDAQIRVSRL